MLMSPKVGCLQPSSGRKLKVTELRPSLATREADRRKGSAAAFPSFVLHRVTPVTKGTRHSLTIWAHGPAFR